MSAYRRHVVRVIALLCFGLGGCASERLASRASSHPITSTAEESTVTRTPHLTPETPMTQGASLSPSDALLSWLEANAKRGDGYALMRLPVVLRIRPDRLGLSGAHIGTEPGAAPAGAIELDLTDTALSVGVWERVRQSAERDQDSVVLWLEGYWRALLPMPALPGLNVGPKLYPFDVRGVTGAVDPSASHLYISPK